MFGDTPPVAVMDVATNDKFVSAISFGNERLARQKLPPVTLLSKMSPIDEADNGQVAPDTAVDLAGDSIVTDSLLQMTSLSSGSNNKQDHAVVDPSSSIEADSIDEGDDVPTVDPSTTVVVGKRSEDMDRVIMELTQAVIKSRSRNVDTMTKAMKSSNGLRRNGIRNSVSENDSLATLIRALSYNKLIITRLIRFEP